MISVAGHQGPATVLLFTSDGQTLLTGGKDGTIRLVHPPYPATEIIADVGHATALALSSDESMLATGSSNGIVRLWDFARRSLIYALPTQAYGITGLSFTPNDQTLSVALGDRLNTIPIPSSLFLWDIVQKKVRYRPDQFLNGLRAMTASPNKSLLAVATDLRAIWIRDLLRPDTLRHPLKTTASTLAFSPNAERLAVASDWQILLFSVPKYRDPLTLQSTLTGHKGLVYGVAWSPDGRILLSGSGDRTVRFWDTESGAERGCFEWPIGRVNSVAFSPDGMVAAAAGENGEVFIWDIDA